MILPENRKEVLWENSRIYDYKSYYASINRRRRMRVSMIMLTAFFNIAIFLLMVGAIHFLIVILKAFGYMDADAG
tara:strand:- start:1733 stop:1957 length:225 start_codon:yes stop_codon:yes gene_type:complete